MKIRLPWMSRADRKQWQAARTLHDLGQLTADWLEGTIQSQPGYQPRYGPDDETLPYAQVLATANRGGYLTTASQPGLFSTDANGTEWAQRAAVEGFISDPVVLRQLIDTAEKAGLEVIVNDLQDADQGYGPGAVVTLMDGEIHTSFGRALGLLDLEVMWRGFPKALDIAARALQLTLADPDFGPSTRLWDVLTEATTRAVPDPPVPAPTVLCECGCTAIDWQICQDGCRGVTDQTAGRCEACIDPSVIIDWSQETDDAEPNECDLCGAPYYGARRYCSDTCEIADSTDDFEWLPAPPPRRSLPANVTDAPW
ncbi:DUF6919 domain-containing protein [Streptomyces sp. NPDC048445]|uniref:DUF6919 domain-containing protein n=1 Tax=Streptomyces sp. NPDC048445 TaxID=3365553 RepID=UPI00371C14B0